MIGTIGTALIKVIVDLMQLIDNRNTGITINDHKYIIVSDIYWCKFRHVICGIIGRGHQDERYLMISCFAQNKAVLYMFGIINVVSAVTFSLRRV